MHYPCIRTSGTQPKTFLKSHFAIDQTTFTHARKGDEDPPRTGLFVTGLNALEIANPSWEGFVYQLRRIKGFKEPSTTRVKDIVENDLDDLKVMILQDKTILKTMTVETDPEVINKVLIPKIVQTKYPDLSVDEIDEVSQRVVVDSVVKNGEFKETGDQRFIRLAAKFINIDDLHIDLIQSINPFYDAFEILSKSVNPKTLKLIQDAIESTRIQMTDEEALLHWPKVKAFFAAKGRQPNINSLDQIEKRLAEAVIYLKNQRRKQEV